MKRTSLSQRIAAFIVPFLLTAGTADVQAAIPASERTVLLNLYASTTGAGWQNTTGWNGAAGTECSWFGITCNAGQTTVIGVALPDNRLTGSLPGNLGNLPNLQVFDVHNNIYGGAPVPIHLVNPNRLTGTLPALAGLTNLQTFNAANIGFPAGGNGMTGPIPVLSGLTNLQTFDVSYNLLTGPIPALTGLTSLQSFGVDTNQLTGGLPGDLNSLTNLQVFDVGNNQLSGPLPALTGLVNLQFFYAFLNQLNGPLPALAGLTSLQFFDVHANQLTGTIPALAGLANLLIFAADSNQLSGPIPALAGLASLHAFRVGSNQLSGNVPSVPSPDNLGSAQSSLCPNLVNHTSDPSWDVATGQFPWYAPCAVVATAPPTIGMAFGAASIALNGSTSLTFIIANPNASTALTGIGFTDPLPAGLVVSTPNALGGSCVGNGTLAAVAGSASVVWGSATLAGGGSCTFSLNVTGTSTGTKNNATSNVSSTEGGQGGAALASLTVLAGGTAVDIAIPLPALSAWLLVLLAGLLGAAAALAARKAGRHSFVPARMPPGVMQRQQRPSPDRTHGNGMSVTESAANLATNASPPPPGAV